MEHQKTKKKVLFQTQSEIPKSKRIMLMSKQKKAENC